MGRLLDIARSAQCDTSDKSDESPPVTAEAPPFVANVALVANQSEAELDISRAAARDLDQPMRCESCGEVRPVMLLMEPGPDGQPWALCGRCWA